MCVCIHTHVCVGVGGRKGDALECFQYIGRVLGRVQNRSYLLYLGIVLIQEDESG